MNKKIIFRLTLGAFLLGSTAFGVAGTASAADATATSATAATATAATTATTEHKSMVLSMRDVAGIFLAKYPNSAVHSISLQPENGKFAYKVSGYTVRNTYNISVDVITGKITAAGDGSIAKGWSLEADKGAVEYTVTVYRNNTEKLYIIMDAVNGNVVKKSLPEKLPLEED